MQSTADRAIQEQRVLQSAMAEAVSELGSKLAVLQQEISRRVTEEGERVRQAVELIHGGQEVLLGKQQLQQSTMGALSELVRKQLEAAGAGDSEFSEGRTAAGRPSARRPRGWGRRGVCVCSPLPYPLYPPS